MDKGIIFDLDNGELEGIVPLKRIDKIKKQSIRDNYKEGNIYDVVVQEVDEEYKKIILMMEIDMDNNNQKIIEDSNDEDKSEKLEIPQDVIDAVSKNEETSIDDNNIEK